MVDAAALPNGFNLSKYSAAVLAELHPMYAVFLSVSLAERTVEDPASFCFTSASASALLWWPERKTQTGRDGVQTPPRNTRGILMEGAQSMASLDWSQCPAVESVAGKVSGAWVFRGTRTPVSTVFENLQDMSVDELIEEFGVTREQVQAVLQFAAHSAEAPTQRP